MLMAQKYETQEYQVIDQIDNAEIRFYPSAAMVKISADQNRNNNFGKLFRYIAGNNQENEEIAMTTPVYMSDQNGLAAPQPRRPPYIHTYIYIYIY